MTISPSILAMPFPVPDLLPSDPAVGATGRGKGPRPRSPSSTLLGRGEGGESVEGEGLAAEGAGAEDEGEHDLQFVQDLVEGHPGAGAFGSVRIMVQKAWARAARVTWRCQPR